MASKRPAPPGLDDELKAVERTGAHDAPTPFRQAALLGTAELAVPAIDTSDTQAAEPPDLFQIPDPEDAPLPRRLRSVSDPEGPPLREIPLPDSDPPDAGTGVIDIPVAPSEVRSSPRMLRSAAPVPLPALSDPPRPAPTRPQRPEASRTPAARPAMRAPTDDIPEDNEPSVVLDQASLEDSTRVFDRQAVAPGPVLPRGRLVVVQGDQVGKAWYLNRPLTFLGRGNDNDIVLLDLAASRKHLRLDRHAEGFRVQDLQSGNGTLLNGRRITREELYDGDRLEVGGHILEFTNLGTPRARPRDTGRTTDPGIAVRPVSPPAPGAVPRSWVILWSVATFLAVFGAMYLTRMLRQGRSDPAPATRPELEPVVEPVVVHPPEAVATAQSHLANGRIALGQRAWARARAALEAAQSEGVDLPEIRSEMARLVREEKAEMALRLAHAHRAGGQLDAARAALAEIPAESTYSAEARALEGALNGAPGSAAPGTAAPGTAPPGSAVPVAPATAAPAGTAAPATPGTAAPATAAPASKPPREAPASKPPREAPASKPPREAPATRAPREAPASKPPREAPASAPAEPATDPFPQATAAYQGRRFSEARSLLERAAKQGSADKRRLAESRAQSVAAVADALAQADAAEAAGRRGEAAQALERAIAADRSLGGALGPGLRPALARHLVYEALRDFIARKYPESARKNLRALGLDPKLSQAQDLARKLEAQASQLLDRARSADGDERKRLAEQAKQLVAPNSTLARDADDLLKE